MHRLIQLRRTVTPDRAPDTLAEGELALGLGNDPQRIWLGVGGGAVQGFVSDQLRDLRQRIEALEAAARAAKP